MNAKLNIQADRLACAANYVRRLVEIGYIPGTAILSASQRYEVSYRELEALFPVESFRDAPANRPKTKWLPLVG